MISKETDEEMGLDDFLTQVQGDEVLIFSLPKSPLVNLEPF